MTNEQILLPYFQRLYKKIEAEDFVIDKTNVKLVELLGEKIELDPTQLLLDFKVKKSNVNYIEKELNWYKSQNLSIFGYVDDIKIWREVADDYGDVISNYGWMIYSSANYNQYQRCLNELLRNKESRRAVMIYQRPSMWLEYNSFNKNDFCCTDGVQCFIRNNQLIYIVKQRSQDAIFGFFNDFAWHCYVYNELYNDLKKEYSNLQIGKILQFSFSFHVYERHFNILEEIVKSNE